MRPCTDSNDPTYNGGRRKRLSFKMAWPMVMRTQIHERAGLVPNSMLLDMCPCTIMHGYVHKRWDGIHRARLLNTELLLPVHVWAQRSFQEGMDVTRFPMRLLPWHGRSPFGHRRERLGRCTSDVDHNHDTAVLPSQHLVYRLV
jgi:hypothetical protein